MEDDLDALEALLATLTQAKAKGAVIVALYSLTGSNVADMPLADFETLPTLLAELRRLRRVEAAARAEAEAEDAYAALEAEHYPSESPENEAGDAWERLVDARAARRAALSEEPPQA